MSHDKYHVEIIDEHNTYMAELFIRMLTKSTPRERGNLMRSAEADCKNPEHKTNWDEILNYLEHRDFIKHEWNRPGELTSLTDNGQKLKEAFTFKAYNEVKKKEKEINNRLYEIQITNVEIQKKQATINIVIAFGSILAACAALYPWISEGRYNILLSICLSSLGTWLILLALRKVKK